MLDRATMDGLRYNAKLRVEDGLPCSVSGTVMLLLLDQIEQFCSIPDSKVASNEALLELLDMLPAEAMKAALVATIREHGLTFNQRDLVQRVTDGTLAREAP